MYQNLNTPLQSGKVYCLSFFIKRSQRSTYATKNIEVFFSNNSVNTGSLGYINAIPQIAKQNVFISDTANWIEIQGCFTANGGEQFITIGNFNNNANTDTLFIGTNNPIPSYGDFSHYYIDDITLIDQSTVGVNELNVRDNINLYPNPNNGTMQLDYNLGSHTNAKFNLFDITGKLIQSVNIETNEGSLYINEQNLKNGVYFYSILVGERNIKTDKIVIIK